MHDYSRDIMLANAQTEMEANLAKMELAKKDSITKQNTEKASNLKRENENLGFMFIPSSVTKPSVSVISLTCSSSGYWRDGWWESSC